MTLFEIFQILISNGHRHIDILDYSLSTFNGYMVAVRYVSNVHIADLTDAMAMAYHATSKARAKYVKELKS